MSSESEANLSPDQDSDDDSASLDGNSDDDDFEEKPKTKKQKVDTKKAPAKAAAKAPAKPKASAAAKKAPPAKPKEAAAKKTPAKSKAKIAADSTPAKGEGGEEGGSSGTKGSGKKRASSGASSSATKAAKNLESAGVKKTPEEAVTDYMKTTNRPYSTINMFDNLHKAIPKPLLQQICTDLADKHVLVKKEYGKSVIFYYNQDLLEKEMGAVNPAKIAEAGRTEALLSDQVRALTTQLADENKAMQSLAQEPPDSELDAMLEQLAAENDEREAKIAKSKGTEGKIDPAAMLNANKEFNAMRAIVMKRRDITKTWVGHIAEGQNKKEKLVAEQLGLDMDAPGKVYPPKL